MTSPGCRIVRLRGAHRLDGFLSAAGVSVLDVRRGAAHGTRRLLIGEPGSRVARYVAAVADHPKAAVGIDTETRVLEELRANATAAVRATLPEIVTPTTVGDRPAVVLTAAGGLCAGPAQPAPPLAVALEAMGAWLTALWRATGGVEEPVDLGRAAADRLLARCFGSRRLGPTLGAVHRARRRLGASRVSRTAEHGCLCARHTQLGADGVIGVDDWSTGSHQGEPLRDLGGYAVRRAAGRLPEVLADRTVLAHGFRDFVVAGLTSIGLPGERWRDVLVLAQVERAVAGLENGRVDQIGLLAASVEALPREHEETEAVS